MPKLSAGGMEISLINFLNISRFVKEFKVTLCLGYVTDKKYLDMLPKNITVRLMTKGKFDSFGKFKSALKYIVEFFKCLDKSYDMSICYSYHHRALSILARLASHNSIIFMHTDIRLNKKVNFQDFRVIACVSKAAENSILKLYPSYKGKVVVINNFVDGDKILRLANEEIVTSENEKNVPIFINVSRHFEKAKKISRIIDAAEVLKNDGYKFIIWLVGDGENTENYKKMVSEKKLEDIVIFKGRELNPYKYIKRSNCLVVSSDFEGYGMVIDEARVLDIPVISTDVGDAKEIVREGYGVVCGNSYEGIYTTMKEFLESGYTLKQKFSYEEFNKNIDENLYKLKEYFGIFDRKEEE
jgi:glycosyltransferase involved in cell wall biosynthesis